MLGLSGLTAFSASQVRLAARLHDFLRGFRIAMSDPKVELSGFSACAASRFEDPVQIDLDTCYGWFLLTVERESIERLLDLVIPDWRAEAESALPFEWCVICIFDLLTVATPLADAVLTVRQGDVLVPFKEIGGPTRFGTMACGPDRCLMAVSVLAVDVARVLPLTAPAAGAGKQIRLHPGLPVQATVSLAIRHFNLRELSGLARGDVVLMGPHLDSGLAARLWINQAIGWDGTLSSEAAFVAFPPVLRRNPMKIPDFFPAAGAGATPEAGPTNSLREVPDLVLDDLPMHLEVQFHRKTMSLAEMSALASGSIIDLGIDLTDPVVLKVNDKAVGTGQLVRIGDMVGVQIERWTTLTEGAPEC